MSDPYSRYLKRNSIQFKIGFIMIVAVILLTATCYLLYRNLSSIVASIRIDENPELRLLSIRDISMDLEKAGNSVRIFSMTRNPSDIEPYYTIISNIDDKVTRLKNECMNDSVLLAQTDTISRLIEENIIIWNDLLVLYNDDKVMEYMRQLSDQFTSATESTQKRERGILRRVFSRPPESPINEQAIVDDLNKIVMENRSAKDELINQESQLAANSSQITEKFYGLMSKMENEVYDHIKAKGEEANLVAAKTYKWLIMLSISGGLLAVMVLFIIIRFVKKAYAYQVALEKSKDEAEKLARTKELFMANMSHEIRTPVTAISGFTEQLLHEPADEHTSRSLRIIKSSSDHLLKIIDDILDFSKLQNKKLTLEKVHFSISRILSDVYALFERQAIRNNTQLTFSLGPGTPPALLGDPYRLKQIMINLVGNSVKFTKNGTVRFSVSSVIKDEGAIDLIMEFEDTGIGIDESKLDSIFEDFTQAEMSTTRKFGGTGLGLSIVKKLVELHDGTIELKSKKNQGTTIVCRIPYLTGDEKLVKQEVGPPLPVPEEIAGLKILVVDDEEYNRLLFRKILKRWNVDCHEVVNGMDALEILKEDHFDILFMDMRMPGIDGLRTTQFIRNEMKISEQDMPIIFISAAPINEDRDKYKKAGMNDFLQKPFTEEMLLATLQAVMGKNSPVRPGRSNEAGRSESGGGRRIDLHGLYNISGGDNQFVKQMLSSFITTTEKLLNDLQEAVAERKWESAADLAHKMLPPCRHLGALELSTLLNSIEKNTRNGTDTGSVGNLLDRSRLEFRAVADLVNEHIAKMS